jgi:hypothetical protein
MYESSKPQSFLGCVRRDNILGFSGQQRDKFLLSRTPGYGPSVDEKDVPGDGAPMFLCCAICVRIPYQIMAIFAIRQCGSPSPGQILCDALNDFPVRISWVVEELGER